MHLLHLSFITSTLCPCNFTREACHHNSFLLYHMKTENKVRSSQPDSYITLIDMQTRQQWKLDSKIIECSEFLIHMDKQDNEGNILTIDIPSFLKTTTQSMNLIQEFYSLHQYQSSSVKVSKIKMSAWQKAFDPITLRYIGEHLEQRREQGMKGLLHICEFLKLNSMKQVLCTVVAHKNYFHHNQGKMKKQLQENNICYSRIMEINLKRGLMDYAKQFSKDVLDNYRKKLEKKQQNAKP